MLSSSRRNARAKKHLENVREPVAGHAPRPVVVQSRGFGRYATPIERGVYYCCVEALQNAVKHAHGATGAWISLVDDGRLRFEVVDDGAGFDPDTVVSGSGLVNLHDRTATLGGVLAVESVPGRGTRIAGAIPLARLSSNGAHDGDGRP